MNPAWYLPWTPDYTGSTTEGATERLIRVITASESKGTICCRRIFVAHAIADYGAATVRIHDLKVELSALRGTGLENNFLAHGNFRGHTYPMHDKARVPSGTPWGPIAGYSRAVRAGHWIAVAGTTAALPDGGAVGGDDIGKQTREAIRRIADALAQLGYGLEEVVRTRIFVTDISRWEEVSRVHAEFFADIQPASTMVEVVALIDPVLLVEIEADAVIPS